MIGDLTQSEIDEILEHENVGRIGCSAGGKTYVVPTSFVYVGDEIFCHSAPGQKIQMMRDNPDVCFEVDQVKGVAHWQSVICQGKFEELAGDRAEEAKNLLLDKYMALMRSTVNRPHGGEGYFDAPDVTRDMLHSKDFRGNRVIFYKIHLMEKSGRYEHE